QLEKRIVEIRAIASEMKWSSVEHSQIALSDAEALDELLSLREQMAELKALPPFSWGLADKDGNAYLSECCIGDEGCMIDEAEAYNYELEPEHHIHAVPLFTASKPAEGSEIAKFMAGVKNSMAQGVAEAIQKEALLIMFDEITPDTETVAMQYESLVKRINCPEDKC
ncbi:TPA: hypothetical protein ACJIWH_003351, partial [Yersinia enterocolitica]|nr:hypothetical protein [Yersinia enterocolitica]HEB2009072.1 hypothetical protein [Yersinia enterocolitica]HEG1707373.1 hypothetical protein [Yersinia enterocolitica]